MAEFVSSFITGWSDVVKDDICHFLPKVKIINVYDGMIHYKYDGNSRDIEKIPYFNNTFFVLQSFSNNKTDFSKMVSTVAKKKHFYLISKGSFRVRFSKENQFCKVDKNVARNAENIVIQNSKLSIDRLNPTTEIWYVIRRENFSFCGQLLSKREFTEKNLNKGELRPEVAYLMCCYANIQPEDVVLEPFAGYGSIPIQISKHFKYGKLFVSDIDSERISDLQQKKQLKKESIFIEECSVFDLPTKRSEISCIITDPPWGFFEEIADITKFYIDMFESFRKICSENCKIVILTARVENFIQAAESSNVELSERINTLINGKKASLFKCKLK